MLNLNIQNDEDKNLFYISKFNFLFKIFLQIFKDEVVQVEKFHCENGNNTIQLLDDLTKKTMPCRVF